MTLYQNILYLQILYYTMIVSVMQLRQQAIISFRMNTTINEITYRRWRLLKVLSTANLCLSSASITYLKTELPIQVYYIL